MGQAQICGLNKVLKSLVNRGVYLGRAKKQRHHLVDKRKSIGTKYLPHIFGEYPDAYGDGQTGFRVEFGYTLIYQDPVTDSDADWKDEGFIKWATRWSKRMENTEWWNARYRELSEAGYFIDAEGGLRLKADPSRGPIPMDRTLIEKMGWDIDEVIYRNTWDKKKAKTKEEAGPSAERYKVDKGEEKVEAGPSTEGDKKNKKEKGKAKEEAAPSVEEEDPTEALQNDPTWKGKGKATGHPQSQQPTEEKEGLAPGSKNR